MNFTYKKLLVPAAIMTILSGCGGSGSDSGSSNTSQNAAPVLDAAALETQYSTTYISAADLLEWEFNFKESDDDFNDVVGLEQTYELDLLAGITDPDILDLLTVKNVTFMWEGPKCRNTFTTALDYPDICFPILEELGLMEDDDEGGRRPMSNILFAQELEIVDLQNLPKISTPIYGFNIQQDTVLVTPSMFAPILTDGQTAIIGLIYEVTDGVNTINRRVKITVTGEDSAPIFIQQDEQGEPILDTETGERIPVEVTGVAASEKDGLIVVDLLQGIFDQDAYDVAQLERQVGDLANTYNVKNRVDFTRQQITVTNLMGPDDLLAGTLNSSNLVKRTDEFGTTSFSLILDPSVYADQLVKDEEIVLTFTYTVSDGTNDVDRTFDFTIKGANLKNAPEFEAEDQTVIHEVLTNDVPLVINLFDKVTDPDHDEMFVADLEMSTSEYGIYQSRAASHGSIVLDPYFFSYLAPGETKDFTYTYKVTDGELTSAERVYTVRLKGANANLFAQTDNNDPGFEKYNLTDGPFYWQDSGSGDENTVDAGQLAVNATSAYSGASGLESMIGPVFTRLDMSGIQQGRIKERDAFYVSLFTKQTNKDNVKVIFNNDGDWNDLILEQASPSGSEEWVEHSFTVPSADPLFWSADTMFDVTFQSGIGFMDDVKLVKFNNNYVTRRLVDATFDSAGAGGWQISGDAMLEAVPEANRISAQAGNGLLITGGTVTTELYLDSIAFPQGAIKKGMRYIVQFEMRDEDFSGTDATPLEVFFREEVAAGTISRQLKGAVKDTFWNSYQFHINTVSAGHDENGAVNSNVDFDWTNAAVTFGLKIPAGATFHIDNIRVYPVPQ